MRPAHILLVLVLVLAGYLRFSGLGWGLRHVPDPDERVFVEHTRQMIEQGSFDPGWYEYPGLYFWMLRGALAAAPAAVREGPEAYLLARGLVAACSLVSVCLAFLLGRRLLGEAAGVLTALWLAVSPVEVQTAHMVRPDVVLGTCVLAALLAFTTLGPGVRGDALSGAALGACLATKFTGAAMGPAFVLARLTAPGARFRGLLVGGACAAAVVLASTPRVVTDPASILGGMRAQSGYMYDAGKEASRGEAPVLYYAGRYARSLGPLGAALAVLGLASVLRRPRPFLPALAYSGLLLAVLLGAEARFERLIASTLGVAVLLAAAGLSALAARFPQALVAPLAALAVALPGIEAVGYATALRAPLTRDVVLDWIEDLPRGARVLSGVPDLGVDRFGYDVAGFSGEGALDALAAARADAVVALQSDPRVAEDWGEVRVAAPETVWSGPAIALLRPRARARFEPLAATGPPRIVSSARGGVESAEIAVAGPRPVACVELRFEAGGGPPPRRLSLELRTPGASEHVAARAIVGWSCGPPARPGERRRALVFEPSPAASVRVRLERDNRLRVAEARVFAVAPF